MVGDSAAFSLCFALSGALQSATQHRTRRLAGVGPVASRSGDLPPFVPRFSAPGVIVLATAHSNVERVAVSRCVRSPATTKEIRIAMIHSDMDILHGGHALYGSWRRSMTAEFMGGEFRTQPREFVQQ